MRRNKLACVAQCVRVRVRARSRASVRVAVRVAAMAMRVIKARSLGRLQLLEWLNAFLESDYSRVEHLKDGIAFAQVLDAVNPGKVRRGRRCARAACHHSLNQRRHGGGVPGKPARV